MARPIQILYATVSGNAEQLAGLAAARLQAAGYPSAVANIAEFPVSRLGGSDVALLIVSTWGYGEPPPDAEAFCAALQAENPPKLPLLRYAVLALGSRSYTEFCWCGRRIDEGLAGCGARRLLPRVECDTKYLADFEAWIDALLKILPKTV
ncbi:MAG: flavodoxin domain-containing protein [Opitutae bacterium]|nr:flavodoxin domain-containing protein [Opitutae bacterium]